MSEALEFALALLKALPTFIQVGHDATDLIHAVQDMNDTGRAPSPGEWDDLDARIATWRGQLHAGEDTTGTDG